jgi:membrane fusion protein, multidrug efflux system
MPDDAGIRVAPALAGLKPRATRGGIWRRALLVAAIVMAVALLGFFGNQWLTVGRYMVTTDNAYVRADISLVSAQVEGYVRSLPVAENQSVHTGDVLAEIEPADYQAQLASARAALAQAQGQLSAQRAQQAQAQADLARNRALAEAGFLSSTGWDAALARAHQAGGGEDAARASVAAAQAQIDAAQLNFERTTIRAPIDGVVGDRQVQVGQLVRTGTPLMSVVPLQSVYVVANFKETQIEHFHAGQTVIIRPDIASSLRLRGELQSLAPASGSEFSIIPTDTATGNFTKIVQRVPVRIRIESGQEGVGLLRPGLSATVTVDTRE